MDVQFVQSTRKAVVRTHQQACRTQHSGTAHRHSMGDMIGRIEPVLSNHKTQLGACPIRASGGPAQHHGQGKPWVGRRGGGQPAGMSASLSRAAAALLRWGRGAVGGGLPGVGVRAASTGGQAEQLDALVKKDKVVVFLKGTPEQPQCGFSNAVVQILRLHGVRDYAAYNVLDDPELRQGIKDYSNWPTIPQVYLNGEFVGGCDILLQMHQNGDLVEELKKLGIRSALVDEKNQDSK